MEALLWQQSSAFFHLEEEMGLKKLGCFSIGAFVFFVLTVGAARLQEDHSHNEGAAHSHDEGSTHSHDETSKAATTPKGSE
ncbi:MAG: hypothetical protein O7A06_11390, partial [Acidobacteria bacterium]|nr:hypothetical protein [Acidobacteriota bacterium]